ncbi:gliding motility-associated C-terminal domain-containing protein [Marinilabilia sp.]|uniref:T9SS type B sorting domain-containing protein n=1 Tax=Marinilabilia sp. TaxID=2021252 RepID=UPI0025C05206|nr:gliding motility-associated C-terminal domain-containing protein [Marinilabilia sp.]
MDKLKILFSTLIYLSLSLGTNAQNGLDAEIISGNIDVCDSESVEVTLDIQFSGQTPFKYKIRLFPGSITTSADYIHGDDLDVNGVYRFTTNISLSIPEGQASSSFLIQVTEMSSDGTTYIPTTDPGVTFTNWTLPSPNAGVDIDSCGLSAVLSAAPDPVSSVYSWETPTQGILTDPLAINSSYSVSSAGTYPLTFKQENGVCTAQDEVQVVFRGSPSASVATFSEVCGTTPQDAVLNLSFTGNDSPWSFAVSDQENQQITGSATTSVYNETVNVQGETTYSLLWVKDSNGCLANPEDLTGEATIVDLKPETNAGTDFLSCGLSTQLSAISDKGTGQWTSVASPITIASVSDPASVVTASEQGVYTMTWTENNNGCENSDQVEVQFIEMPSISFENIETRICEGSEASIPFTIGGNNSPWTLNYSINEEAQSVTYQSPTSALISAPTETTNIHLTSISDQFSCVSELGNELSIIVDQMPTPFAGNDTAVCGLQIDLNGSMSPSAQHGEWQITSGNILNNEINNPAATYQQSTWGETTLTWIETNGLCTATDDVRVRFDEPPVAFAGEDLTLYNQYETILRAGQPVSYTENWVGEWYISSGPGIIANPGDQNATLTGLKHGTVNLEWSVTNGVCPEVSDNLTITVKGLTYYTGISPLPKDNRNDYFSIKGAHTIPQNELVIFDQSGAVVFKKSNLEEGNQWEGVDADGNPLENGIYYFIFKGDGIDPVKDYIVIKRKHN